MNLAVLAVLAVVLLWGCGGGDDRPAAKALPAATPWPTATFAEMVPGREYTTRRFKPSIRLTVPAGKWATTGDNPDHVEVEPDSAGPIHDSGIGFHSSTRVFDAARGGVEPGDAGPGPEDFAAWLVDHPHLRSTEPKAVEVLGLRGVSIDVRVKSSQPRQYRDCGKYEGDCVVLMIGAIEPSVMGSRVLGRFFVLEKPGGGQLVVEYWAEPARAAAAQFAVFDDILAGASVSG